MVRVDRLIAGVAAIAMALTILGLPAHTTPEFTSQTLHFQVDVGNGGQTSCDVVADLYLPGDASPSHRVPAILTTNGFGGSKDDQQGIGEEFAGRGYAVLSYSGLGFGGTGCKITLDDRDHDGKAASQLVSYLGGKDGIAFEDAEHTVPAEPLDVIQLDREDHDGNQSRYDPRVGMVGGSYGGHVQFSAAAIDKRIDTIVPLITWNDLEYSLAPNSLTPANDAVSVPSGAPKLIWALGFTALGIIDGVQHVREDPSRMLVCPNFADFVCPALTVALASGVLPTGAANQLHNNSVTSFSDQITIPTLLIQGQNDTLFNINEAVATYRALRAQGTAAKMIWMNGGHSGDYAEGELDLGDPDPSSQYVSGRIADWFDHYLKDAETGTGSRFSYFRDWIDYEGSAAPAYAHSDTYPVGTQKTWALSGDELVTGQPESGTQTLTTTVGKLPTSFESPDVIGDFVPLPEYDAPGTTASWTTDALDDAIDVVGSPSLDLQIDSIGNDLRASLDASKLVLFARIHDVAPDGTDTLVRNLVAPVRVPDVGKPFTVTMPGFVHRFQAGHRIRLTIAGGSVNYLGNTVPGPVSIDTGDPAQRLTLPVTDGASDAADAPKDDTGPDGGSSEGVNDGTDDAGASDQDANSGTRHEPSAGETGEARAAGSTPASASGLPSAGGPGFLKLLAGVVLVLFGTGFLANSRRVCR